MLIVSAFDLLDGHLMPFTLRRTLAAEYYPVNGIQRVVLTDRAARIRPTEWLTNDFLTNESTNWLSNDIFIQIRTVFTENADE